jgi:hypothetical protein
LDVCGVIISEFFEFWKALAPADCVANDGSPDADAIIQDFLVSPRGLDAILFDKRIKIEFVAPTPSSAPLATNAGPNAERRLIRSI